MASQTSAAQASALEEEMAPALDAAQPAVLIVDDARRCIEANPAAVELLGRSRDEIVGVRFEAFLTRAMRERVERFWQAFKGLGGSAGPFTLDDGRAVQISVTTNLIRGRHLLVLSPTAQSRPPLRPVGEEGPRRIRGGASRLPGRPPSARERDILGELAAGLTDPQIAAKFGLSPATVQTHVRNLKSKLGARTRAQAVAIAIEHRLIETY